MGFTLLPAVDIVGGRVRVAPGQRAATDPLAVALGLQAAGAEWIHLVDIDAAFGRATNRDVLASIVNTLDIDVEIAGGVTDAGSLDAALASGCRRVCLGTGAIADLVWCSQVLAEHGDRLAMSLDVRLSEGSVGSAPHRLAARGGGADVGHLWSTMAELEAAGCRRFIVTDAGRDGMLTGLDADFYTAVARATTVPVIASGGASSLDDLRALVKAVRTAPNLEGAIVGAALHAGRFTLAEALDIVGS